MITLQAEQRDMSVKAKTLRRQGKVTGNIYGREMKQPIPIQLAKADIERFFQTNVQGSQAMIDLGDQKIRVLVKGESYQPLTHSYENIDFQALIEGEAVMSTTPIILHGVDNVVGYLSHTLSEIQYMAVPSALVDKIEIDVAGMKAEKFFYVHDLDLAKNKDVELITPADSLIFHITEHQKGVIEEEEEEAAEA